MDRKCERASPFILIRCHLFRPAFHVYFKLLPSSRSITVKFHGHTYEFVNRPGSFSPSKRLFCSLWCPNALVEFLTCQRLIPGSLTSNLCSDVVYPDFAFSSSSLVLEGKCLQINLKSVTIASNTPTHHPSRKYAKLFSVRARIS